MRESAYGRGTREDRSTKSKLKKSLFVSGLEPWPLVCQASALSIALCPWAREVKDKIRSKKFPQVTGFRKFSSFAKIEAN